MIEPMKSEEFDRFMDQVPIDIRLASAIRHVVVACVGFNDEIAAAVDSFRLLKEAIGDYRPESIEERCRRQCAWQIKEQAQWPGQGYNPDANERSDCE